MRFIAFGLRFLFNILLISTIGMSAVSYAAPKDPGDLILESEESQEEMRRRILTTVESAKQYQDMMDEQLKSLKTENKDLHEKLMKLKEQFESVMSGVGENLKQNASSAPASNPPAAGQNPAPSPQTPPQPAVEQPAPMMNAAPSTSVSPAVIPEKPTVAPVMPVTQPLTGKPAQSASEKLTAAFSNLKLLAGLFILGFLILIWFLWGRSSKQVELRGQKNVSGTFSAYSDLKAASTGDNKEVKDLTIPAQQMIVPLVSANQEGEYDYIGSVEAIPAKMDLARMYRDMGDLASAELVLKSVMAQGNDAQFLEASELLEEMKKAS